MIIKTKLHSFLKLVLIGMLNVRTLTFTDNCHPMQLNPLPMSYPKFQMILLILKKTSNRLNPTLSKSPERVRTCNINRPMECVIWSKPIATKQEAILRQSTLIITMKTFKSSNFNRINLKTFYHFFGYLNFLVVCVILHNWWWG